jgi:hypothetical protein
MHYHLVYEYLHHPRLMKLSGTNIDGNCLSSEVVSIGLAYFLNWQHLSLNYVIQFLLIQTSQKLLQGLKKTGPRQPPESVRVFFDYRT